MPEAPRVSLIIGMPLHDRNTNIEHATKRMRERAMEIFDRRDADGNQIPGEELDIDQVAESMEYYADLIETLMHHGSNYFYRNGCSCEWCRESARQYWARKGGRPRGPTFVYNEEEDLP